MPNGAVTEDSKLASGQLPLAARLLLEKLERSGKTQNALARELGIDSGQLSRILTGKTGKRGLRDLRVILRIEELYGIAPKLWLEV